jgi:hypothetical protein
VKKIHFLCSLPRAGQTLFASLLNNTNKITVTANSITPEILYNLSSFKKDQLFLNFPDHKSLDNLINNSLQIYYKDWKTNHILDRSPWGTKSNLSLIKHVKGSGKFIILYRPILECLASFVKAMNPENVENFCLTTMSPGNMLAKHIESMHNLLISNKLFLIISYENLTINPVNTLNTVLKYLNIKHKIKKLKINQLNINGVTYDDTVIGKPIHKIQINNIIKSTIDINKYLPKKIIDKYINIDRALDKLIKKQ